MRQYQPEPRTYELMTILSPEVADDDLQGQIDAIAGYVTGAGGEVMDVNRESPWGRRRLAYAIRHGGRDVRDGYYALFHLRLEPGRVTDVERDIKLNDLILRYLVTHYEPGPVDETAAQPEGAQPTAAAEPAAQQATPVAATSAAPIEPPPAPAAAEPAAQPEPEAAVEAVAAPETAAAEPEIAAEPEGTVAAEATAEPAAAGLESAAAATETPSDSSDATDDQPQVATAGGTEEQAAASPATTPGEEPENPPAQPDATPKEE